MATQNIQPIVGISQNQRVVYERKTWLIFSWEVKVSAEKMANDIVICCDQEIDRVYLNGKELIYK